MKRFEFNWPSPALVVAVVALVAALGGTAIAGGPGAVVSKLNRQKVKTISQRQANKVLTQAAPNLSVGSAAALTQLSYERSNPVTVNPGQNASAIVACPAGTNVVGGGGASQDVTGTQTLSELGSHPSNGTQGQLGFTGWEYRVHLSGTASPHQIAAYAICAKVTPQGNNPATPSNYQAGQPIP